MEIREDDFSANAIGREAVNNLHDFAVERLRQKEKTKRMLMIGVFGLVTVATIILLFVPVIREKFAPIIGAILLVLALGAIGVSKFAFKLFGVTVDTKQSGMPLNPPPKVYIYNCKNNHGERKDDVSTETQLAGSDSPSCYVQYSACMSCVD
jgi:hypothetical protein